MLATVVRTVSVTAAKAGAKAIIRPDGTIVGGLDRRRLRPRRGAEGRARGARRRRAAHGLGAAGKPAGRARRQARREPRRRALRQNMCPSKGTMDIFVEPVLPHPSLVILGASPVALSLAAQARQLGYHVTLAAPAADRAPTPDADMLIDGYALGQLNEARRFVVVSTQGKGDEAALRAAVATDAAYHAFVGSRRKMAALREKLIARGHRRRRARPRQGAGRPRPRRHHAGGDRDVDSGRDHAGAQARAARGGEGVTGVNLKIPTSTARANNSSCPASTSTLLPRQRPGWPGQARHDESGKVSTSVRRYMISLPSSKLRVLRVGNRRPVVVSPIPSFPSGKISCFPIHSNDCSNTSRV